MTDTAPSIDWQADDPQLVRFARLGTPPLPAPMAEGWVETEGARIWFACCGNAGPALVLLHGGMGHAGNWSLVVPHFLEQGWGVVLIDSRGHGHSTRDGQPFSYELMARDTERVLDHLGIAAASFIGWSDGACTVLALAKRAPERVRQLVFFACNVDATGSKPFVATETIENCIEPHRLDYDRLSATPGSFDDFMAAVNRMQSTQPSYDRTDLAAIAVPVAVLQSRDDEFIRFEHAEYIASALPRGQLAELAAGMHFAPLQYPGRFASAVGTFLPKP